MSFDRRLSSIHADRRRERHLRHRRRPAGPPPRLRRDADHRRRACGACRATATRRIRVLRRAAGARRELHRHGGLVRAARQRDADRRGAASVSGGAGDRDQGRASSGPGAEPVGDRTATRSTCAPQCEGSLRRLKRRAHRPVPAAPHRPARCRPRSSSGCSPSCVREGKVRHVGLSEVTVDADRGGAPRSCRSPRCRTATTWPSAQAEDVLDVLRARGDRLHSVVPAAHRAARRGRGQRRSRETAERLGARRRRWRSRGCCAARR